MQKPRNIIYTALFLALVLLLWLGLSFLPGPTVRQLPADTPGHQDLRGLDFTDTVYRIATVWDSWPEQLYTPAELAETEQPPVAYDSWGKAAVPRYATFRLYLHLPLGETYGITARSSDYAMRLYLNGEEVESAGRPAATAAESTAAVREFAYYFTPTEETTELVVQFANHVHYGDGTKAPKLTVGTAANISAYLLNARMKTSIIFGCLVAAFLYYLAAFLLNRRQRASLLFALLCLVMAFLSAEGFATMNTGYNWLVLYRLSYVGTLGAAALLVGLVNALFPGVMHRYVRRAYLGLCGGYALLAIFAPTMVFTRVLVVFHIVSVAVIAYSLVCLVLLALRQRRLKNMLAVLGVALFGLFSIYDILHQNGIGPALYIQGQRVIDAAGGLVLLAACYALVLAIDQAETNTRLQNAQEQLAKAEANYQRLLDEQESIQTPRQILAGLGLTKRETEIALLLLDGKSREEIAVVLEVSKPTVNFHCGNLYKKAGVANLADFVLYMSPKDAVMQNPCGKKNLNK